MDQIDKHRRKWLALGSAAMGVALLPHQALATLSTPRPRVLVINNLHTGETLKTEFFDGKKYNRDELARLNHLFRDYRAEQVKNIDPQLFDHLYRLQIMLGTSKPVQLISGYRTLATNNSLRKHGSGVAKHSYHTLGQAMDFHIQGVDLANIRKAALKMRMGGVGYYPRSDFVHIDTGPARSWS
ncbi:YcbK family protein [Rouxiella chamberiensis]|uniref:Murein endopeptidase K n=1 Tax=Rouxiella chamberiensis TaxID=1513468 RepID=A0ABY7HK16_9GAMM|nr:YcbK family protein [Rouxiella chamberiensis]WAS99690.1 YcbK family protein [Rouxiella chamberiensis]